MGTKPDSGASARTPTALSMTARQATAVRSRASIVRRQRGVVGRNRTGAAEDSRSPSITTHARSIVQLAEAASEPTNRGGTLIHTILHEIVFRGTFTLHYYGLVLHGNFLTTFIKSM